MADFRVIPSIDVLRKRPAIAALERQYGNEATLEALRNAAGALRSVLGGQRSIDAIPADAEGAAQFVETTAARTLRTAFEGSLRRVINATGVVIHTNLGRAPLADAAIERVTRVARGYCNLEYDLANGARGSRSVHAEALLAGLTGADAAVVVNNNAAATMLILAALAAGREVIISRGELVEIGGGFRVPDVMQQSGAILREVGTTNRTRAADYRAAIGPKTAMLLRVHPSNFRIEGFTERPSLDALVAEARAAGIPLVEDLGGGALLATAANEPTVQDSVAAGADLVCFSGDKLLGGPQAGIVVGRRDLVQQLRTHPLMRALRVDKLTYAALEGTLLEYKAGRAAESIPVVRMIALTPEAIEARARVLAERLSSAGWNVALMTEASAIGGGSAPGVDLPTVVLALSRPDLSVDAVETRLRGGRPPIIARISDDRVLLDLRTVDPDDDQVIGDALEGMGRD